jgi:hypothetical protein
VGAVRPSPTIERCARAPTSDSNATPRLLRRQAAGEHERRTVVECPGANVGGARRGFGSSGDSIRARTPRDRKIDHVGARQTTRGAPNAEVATRQRRVQATAAVLEIDNPSDDTRTAQRARTRDRRSAEHERRPHGGRAGGSSG